MAEETISLRWTPKIKAMSRFSLGGTTSPKRCRAKKTKVLIQMCFSGQTVEVGSGSRSRSRRVGELRNMRLTGTHAKIRFAQSR